MRWVGACALAWAGAAEAQTSYYSLDPGHPTRIDDATPTERYAVELTLASFRIESYPGGLRRYRAEPKLSYGLLPRTELAVRMPVVRVQAPGASPQSGVTSLGVGAMHELTLEGKRLPALALGGEWLFPAGNMAPPGRSFGFRGMATKTWPLFRVHMNVGWGTYSVQPTSNAPDCVPPPRGRKLSLLQPGVVYCTDTTTVRVPQDIPCNVAPASNMELAAVGSPDTLLTPSYGHRTFFGLAVDHAFARQSTLVVADITTERFPGLYPTADLTVEIGGRHQLTPWLVFDAGVSRRIHGAAQYTAVTIGATLDLPGTPEFCAP